MREAQGYNALLAVERMPNLAENMWGRHRVLGQEHDQHAARRHSVHNGSRIIRARLNIARRDPARNSGALQRAANAVGNGGVRRRIADEYRLRHFSNSGWVLAS